MARSKSLQAYQRSRSDSKSRQTDNLPSHSLAGEILIYLDVDGVLNTTAQRASREHLANELIGNLRRIIDAIPGVAIVMSSSWRLQPQLLVALHERLTAEGIVAFAGVTGELPLPPADESVRVRGEAGFIEAELARLAAQRAGEIQASKVARRPRAWIAIDDLDLVAPLQNSQRMGMPPLLPSAKDASAQDGCVGAGLRLPPLPVRRPFTLAEQRALLPQHPLTAQLPRHSRGSSRDRRPTASMLKAAHFVHTSEAEGLTRERAEHAISLLHAQLEHAIRLSERAKPTLSSMTSRTRSR